MIRINWALVGTVGFILLLLGGGRAADAAQPARVGVDSADVHDSPDSATRVLETTPRGTPLEVSNFPTNGFYKVRTPEKTIGWIAGSDIELSDHEQEPSPEERQAALRAVPKQGGRFEFGLHGGVQALMTHPGNSLSRYVGLGQVMNAGLDFFYYPLKRLGFGLRADYLYRSANITDQTTAIEFQTTLTSLPLMGGMKVDFLPDVSLHFGASLMGGVGFLSRFRADPIQGGQATAFEDTTFGGLGTVSLGYEFAGFLRLFGELGYRYLQSFSLQSPTQAGEHSDVFDGSVPIDEWNLSLSGVQGAVGIQLVF